MNIRDLQYFEAVSRLKNFSQAALECHVSQPTLSTQIKKLEDTLGVSLFERSNKKVMLTEAGTQLVELAKDILHQITQMRQFARFWQDPLGGTLKFGAFPTLSTYLFPQLVSYVHSAFQNIQLQLFEEKTDDLIMHLKNGNLDAALLALPIEHDGFEVVEVFEDEFLLAVPAGHAWSTRKIIKLTDISGQDLLLLDEGHCLREQALEICHISGAREMLAFRATNLETLREMVKIGIGITLIPKIAQRNDDGLYYIKLEPTPKRVIGLVWRQTSPRKPLMSKLAAFLKDLR